MRRLDLPFTNDHTTRFLPWIVALMVFMAAITAAFAIAVGGAVRQWDNGLSGRLTVQVPSAETPSAETPSAETPSTETPGAAAAEDGARAVADALILLRKTPGVVAAEPLAPAAVAALLEPWLGDAAGDFELPLPTLIDVELGPGARIDSATLAAQLASVAPGVAVDDHRVWLDGLIDLARIVQLIALGIVLLIAVSAVAAVVFATRGGMAVHHRLIELLHQIGARDAYVARQFQAHALRLGLRGGLFGSLTAAVVLAGIVVAAGDVQSAFVPSLSLTPVEWAPLAAVPVAAVAIVVVTARLTVLRALAHMP